MLRELREIIKQTVPEAEEKISYQMPYYDYHGRLIYFGGFKEHVSVFVMTATREALHDEIQDYLTSKSTLKFPVAEPLPVELIVKIIRTQARFNRKAAS